MPIADVQLAKKLYDAIAEVVAASLPDAPAPRGPQRWLTTKQAAAYLNVKPNTLEIYRVQGKGPKYHKPSKNIVRYDLAELDKFVGGQRNLHSTSEDAPKKRRAKT